MRDRPGWSDNPSFLQLRGRTLLQFAKRCRDTARRYRLAPRLKARSWEQCRQYLGDAERDLRAALDHSPDPVVRDYLLSDLEYLEKLREQARKPGGR